MISGVVAATRNVGRDHGRGGVGLLLALAVLALVAAPASGAAPIRPPVGSRVLFHLHDSRIDEASGIGVGVRSPGVVYVENDSGDTNRFFALDAHTGRTAAVITVPHATNVDWEDLQVAPDAAGTSCVWLADIGDNDAVRPEIEIYRVPEPRVDPNDTDVAITSARPDEWRLRYPDGPTDAESLAVTQQGHAYLITKSFLGVSDVYRLPARPDAHRVRTLTRVGTIDFDAVRSHSPIGSAGSVLATSAAVSPNGRLLAVRTYVYADVWRLHPDGTDDGVAAALQTPPTRVVLPAERQGEGIAFRRGRLLIDSEFAGTPVWSVPLPAALSVAVRAPSDGSSRQASTQPAAGPSAPRQSLSATRSPVREPPGKKSSGLSVLVVVLLLGAVFLLGRRARDYGRRGDDDDRRRRGRR